MAGPLLQLMWLMLFRHFQRLTGAAATVKNENGLEVFYGFAITPAIRLAHLEPHDRWAGEK